MSVSKTLDELINSTIFDLAQPDELGLRVVFSDALTTTSTTTFTLTSAAGVNVSDVVEFGNELVLVTAKSALAVPVFTCSRGYYNTIPEAHSSGDVGHVNPPFSRSKVAEAVKRSFNRLEALGVPNITSTVEYRSTDLAYLELPADVREVLQVLYWGTDGRLLPLDGWEMFDYLPVANFTTGKALNLPRYVSNTDELQVVYRAPYRWSTYPAAPGGDATISMPEGTEDLPAVYAAAWLVSSREISRSEIDRSEEWSRTVQQERGVTSALVRAKWQEFYRALDEARRLNLIPQPIKYKRRPKV